MNVHYDDYRVFRSPLSEFLSAMKSTSRELLLCGGVGGSPIPGQPANREQCAADQERDVVYGLIRPWSYVMQIQDVVIDQAVEDMEQSPARNHRSNQCRL